MTIKDKYCLLIGALIPLFILGLLSFWMATTALRKGELKSRGGWVFRRHEPIFFWFLTTAHLVAGLGIMWSALRFALKLVREL